MQCVPGMLSWTWPAAPAVSPFARRPEHPTDSTPSRCTPFVSEFLVLVGTFTVHKTVAVIATVGIVLGAAYVLWMLQRTTQGTPNPALASIPAMRKDLSLREAVVVAPLIALLIFFGFYPKPLLDVINPAIAATMQDIGKQDPPPTAVQNQEATK